METDRELLAATTAPSLLQPSRRPPSDDAVPMLRFLVGTGRAAVALARFLLAVARDDAGDPIDLEPRILRSV